MSKARDPLTLKLFRRCHVAFDTRVFQHELTSISASPVVLHIDASGDLALYQAPTLMAVLHGFAAESCATLGRVEVVRLGPGFLFVDWSWACYHLVLASPSGSMFCAGDQPVPETVTMQQGELWSINKTALRRPVSTELQATHVVFDLSPCVLSTEVVSPIFPVQP